MVYNATNVTLENVTVTAANAGIQVNSSEVTLSGTITVSDNEWGGIEVCKGSGIDNGGTLNINGATVVCSDTDVPAIWIDGTTEADGVVIGTDSLYTYNTGTQIYYFTVIPQLAQARVGNELFATLVSAVDAVTTSEDKTGTVTLLKDCEGAGIGLFAKDGDVGVNLTIDFGGHTYTCVGPAVGSTGTQSQAFHLERGNTVTLKNGSIYANSTSVAMLIQNYCNLKLDGVTLDATQGTNAVTYSLSNNFGEITITGNTNIIAKAGGCAFDVYYWPKNGYGDGVSVTVDENMTGTIVGRIEYGSDNSADGKANIAEKAHLTIAAGTFEIELSTYNIGEGVTPSISITGGSFQVSSESAKTTLEQYVADGAQVSIAVSSVSDAAI